MAGKVERWSKEMVSILAQPGGRALRLVATVKDQLSFVSILAQPGGRALHHAQSCVAIIPVGFNPRPARGPGAAI